MSLQVDGRRLQRAGKKQLEAFVTVVRWVGFVRPRAAAASCRDRRGQRQPRAARSATEGVVRECARAAAVVSSRRVMPVDVGEGVTAAYLQLFSPWCYTPCGSGTLPPIIRTAGRRAKLEARDGRRGAAESQARDIRDAGRCRCSGGRRLVQACSRRHGALEPGVGRRSRDRRSGVLPGRAGPERLGEPLEAGHHDGKGRGVLRRTGRCSSAVHWKRAPAAASRTSRTTRHRGASIDRATSSTRSATSGLSATPRL